jgi:hypothetical protein
MKGTKLKKGITLVAVLVGVLAVTSGAFAAKQYFITSSSQIKDGAVKLHDLSSGARHALRGEKGAKGDPGAAGPQGLRGAAGQQGPQGNAGQAGASGKDGEVGPAGAAGKDGESGKDGAAGAQGPQGPAGPAGDPGKDGRDGESGKDGKDAPAPEYGVGGIYVTRGTGQPVRWATYSTRLGSPVGDTTGGTFRFTCTATQASCKIAVQAAVLSDSAAGSYAVYPRVLVQRAGDPDTGNAPQTYCEYADGSTTSLTPVSLATNPFASNAPLTVNIGGSADCGLEGPAGNVNEIVVPKGYYDVMTTFVFTKS